MATTKMTYSVPEYIAEGAHEDRAGAMALFLLETMGSTGGLWQGYMKKADQDALFGRYFGRGRISIDGELQEVWMSTSCSFDGNIRDIVDSAKWSELNA